MKKIILFLLIFLGTTSVPFAQPFHIEKSAEFDEPDFGWNKLLQLSNGNTFMFHAENKEGIEVVVYGKDRKIKTKRTLTGKLWDEDKLKKTKIAGLFEINGAPVLFLTQENDEKKMALYRLVLNPNTSAIEKENDLGQIPMSNKYAIAFGNSDPNNIIIEKDPNSSNYAIIFFNGAAHDRSERIRVLHIDSMHNVINEAFYESPGGAFKYLRFIGAVVDGDKRVFVTTYGFNAKDEDASSRIIVSSLTVGSKEFKHQLLDFSEDFNNTTSIMLYNRGLNKIQLLTLSLVNDSRRFNRGFHPSKRVHLVLLSYIDPETLALNSVKPIFAEKVSEYVKTHFDSDDEYEGLPQQMVINKDNTTTLLCESMISEITYNGHTTQQKTFLGPVGISELNDTGGEMHGYAINKKQEAQGILPSLYINSRSKGEFMNAFQNSMVKSNSNQFMSFDYVGTDKGRYVIFNDLAENYDKAEDETKRRVMRTISGSNTICFKLSNDKVEKSFLFGEPDDKESNFCFIEASDYNKASSTYATIIIEREKKDKTARVAWVKFE